MDVSIIIPCLNEEKTIISCIKKAFYAIKQNNITGEVIVVDNESTDLSANYARKNGAKVVIETTRGYGCTILRGIKEAEGKIIVMADGDGTYDFSELKNFITPIIKNNADLVIGNRLRGSVCKHAMPALHRFVGTPFLTWIFRIIHGGRISDINCGMRAFRKTCIEKLNLTCTGMEFASEMLIRASYFKLNIQEIPINLYPSHPGRKSHLNTFRDGWRHLKIILTLCPKKSLFFPSITLSVILLSIIYYYTLLLK